MELIPCCSAWKGYKDCNHKKPEWVYNAALHRSHKSNLLRKDYLYYSKYYDTNIPIDLPYIWTT